MGESVWEGMGNMFIGESIGYFYFSVYNRRKYDRNNMGEGIF